MKQIQQHIGQYLAQWAAGWNGFWFQRRDPVGLGLIRIAVGVIVLYTHLVWTLELSTFFGNDGVLPTEYRQMLFGSSFAWSHFDGFGSGSALPYVHLVGLLIMLLFTLGLWTRVTSVLTALLVISYANRAMGALFGLDQINAFLCLYLAIGSSGKSYSLDAWFSKRKRVAGAADAAAPDVLTNIATRLIQVHMCIVYLFAGIGKLQGETWFNGEAVWGALASYEYQTFDMTWLAGYMWAVAILTMATLAWEVAYVALIWPRLTRPLMLAIAIPIHLGIGICMGMLSFGLIMLAGNLAFIPPAWLRGNVNWRPEVGTPRPEVGTTLGGRDLPE